MKGAAAAHGPPGETEMTNRLTPSAPPEDYLIPVAVERFYDRSQRTWTAYAIDAHGNQVGPAQYAHTKAALSLDHADY
jgi:hypothetical protein